MALFASTGLRNKILDNGSLKSILAGGFIHIYASALSDIPATADAAIDVAKHTKLVTIFGDGVSAGLNLGVAAAGAIGKAVGDVVTRYNEIVEEVETDPSLKIEFRQ